MRHFALSAVLVVSCLLSERPVEAQIVDAFPEISVGATAEGRLIPGGATFGGRGEFSVHQFEGRAGVRYQAEARSSDFDAYLLLARPVGGLTDVLGEDDDGGEGSDARLRFTLERTGPHFLIVQSYGSDGRGGSFTLSVEERALPAPPAARPISPGQTVQGRIDATSGVVLTDFDRELPHDLWVFEGRGGDHFVIAMDSDDFDAYLDFGPMSGDSLLVQQQDDDGGEGTNPLLRVRLPHDGRFGVRARPLNESGTGTYTLRVTPFTPAPPVRRLLRAGETVVGSLTPEDALLEERIPYQEWVYEGREGEQVRIRMSSDDFDSYLSFGREEADGSFVELAFNDDAPNDGLNSGIEYRLPASGNYVIRARPYSSGTGTYALELISGG